MYNAWRWVEMRRSLCSNTPTLIFTSRRIEALDEAAGRYRVRGDLTVRGVTREVVLDALYTPATLGAREPRIRLDLTTALNRREFGLVWNKSIINVADSLTVTLDVEATRA